jgi:hypothetical protein
MNSVIIYLLVFSISTAFIDRGRKYTKVFGMIILIMFAAGRYHVGTDVTTYTHIFERYSSYSWSYFFEHVGEEWMFALLAKITYSVGGRVLTWGVFAALIIVPVYLALRTQYPDLSMGVSFFSFLFFYYATSFNITRQMIAVAIIFWGMKYVFENRFIPYLIVVAVATLFHLSAPAALLIWILWDHKENCAVKGVKRFAILMCVVIVVFEYQLAIEFVTGHMDIFSTYSSYAQISTRGQNRDLYVSILELAIALILSRNLCEISEKNNFMISLLFISALIGITGFTHPQVKRIAYYFTLPAELVLLGYLPYCFTENSRFAAKILLCLYSFSLFVITAYILGESNLIPYRFDLFSAW